MKKNIFIIIIIFINKKLIFPNEIKAINVQKQVINYPKNIIYNNDDNDRNNMDNASKFFGGFNPGTNPYLGIYGTLNWRQLDYFNNIFKSLTSIINGYYLMIPEDYFNKFDKTISYFALISKINDMYKTVIFYEDRFNREINYLKISINNIKYDYKGLINFYNLQEKYVLFKMKYFIKFNKEFSNDGFLKILETLQININNIKFSLISIHNNIDHFHIKVKKLYKIVNKDNNSTDIGSKTRSLNFILAYKTQNEFNINLIKDSIIHIKQLKKVLVKSLKYSKSIKILIILKISMLILIIF